MNLVQIIRGMRDRADAPRGRRPVSRLRVETGGIVRGDELVRLSGASLFWPNLQPHLFCAQTVQWLARDWRLNLIRVPIGIAPEGPPMMLSDAVALAKRVIDAAIAEDIYVLVDWHAHDELAEGAYCLASLAEHYRDQPNILYETWNEPAPRFGWDTIRTYHEKVIDAVRVHAPSALIVAGTPEHSKRVDTAALAPLARPNIAYALHFYAGTHREGLRARARAALSRGLTLLASEWGACEANGDGLTDWAEANRWLAFLKQYGVGDITWAISSKQEASSALRARSKAVSGWGRSDLTPAGRFHRSRLRAASDWRITPALIRGSHVEP